MKLYVCYGTFNIPGRSHPCTEAYDALVAAGHKPKVVRVYGWGRLPEWMNPGRRRTRELTGGSNWVPVLEGDNGELLGKSTAEIISWAEKNPA
jgi:hypothetical protein